MLRRLAAACTVASAVVAGTVATFLLPMVRATRLTRVLVIAVALALCLAGIGCSGGDRATGPTAPSAEPPGPVVPPPATPSGTQVFVGAGDIARCDALEPARQTARLLAGIGGTVFTLGDNAYYSGTAAEFRDCYDPTWGREKSRTRPTLGNHEYEGGNAGGPYFAYFGANAGPPGLGYYSFDLGSSWHAIALNSNIQMSETSAQGQWLKSDLATSQTRCTIAYWHHPLFTSGPNGSQTFMRDFWRILYNAGADIVLSGHDHLYERFAPQDFDGRPDAQRGIRQFTVGTGGAALYDFVTRAANSEARVKAFGVLKLTLEADSYDWQFTEISGAVSDSGSGRCH